MLRTIFSLLGRALVASTLLWFCGVTAAADPEPKRTDGALLPRDSRDAAIFRGGLVYANYCVTCHGINADGNGRAARLHNPRPANLRASDKNDEYIRLIVIRGGELMGRSPKMPPWGEELTDEQVNDIVAFVRSVNLNAAAPDQTALRGK
jgi:mono/diheme cytochrome c family protein